MRCERPISLSLENAGDLTLVSRKGRKYPVIGRKGALVPCGKCFACLSRRKSQATFRMDCEKRYGHLKKHIDGSVTNERFKYAFFVSLSYANEFLPYSWDYVDKRTGEYFQLVPKQEDPILVPSDLRLFFKRLSRYSGIKYSYYACGEYGDDFNRPHYHIIFYSDLNWTETREAVRHAWSVSVPKSSAGMPGVFMQSGTYDTFRKTIGRIDVKPVNMRRMRYVAKYVVKDGNDNKVVPKFARCSKSLGSGFLWSDQARQVRQSKALFAYSVDGKKCSLGRYFTYRLYTKSELSDLVDKFVDDESAPLDIVPGSKDSENWYREHIADSLVSYRAWKANQKNPLLIYL